MLRNFVMRLSAPEERKNREVVKTHEGNNPLAKNPWTFALILSKTRRLRKLKTWFVPCEAIDVHKEGDNTLVSLSRLSKSLSVVKEIIGQKLGLTVSKLVYEPDAHSEGIEVENDDQWITLIEQNAQTLSEGATKHMLDLVHQIKAGVSEDQAHFIAQVWVYAMSPHNHDTIASHFLASILESSIAVNKEEGERTVASLGVLGCLGSNPRMVGQLSSHGLFSNLRGIWLSYMEERTGKNFNPLAVAGVISNLGGHSIGQQYLLREGRSAVFIYNGKGQTLVISAILRACASHPRLGSAFLLCEEGLQWLCNIATDQASSAAERTMAAILFAVTISPLHSAEELPLRERVIETVANLALWSTGDKYIFLPKESAEDGVTPGSSTNAHPSPTNAYYLEQSAQTNMESLPSNMLETGGEGRGGHMESFQGKVRTVCLRYASLCLWALSRLTRTVSETSMAIMKREFATRFSPENSFTDVPENTDAYLPPPLDDVTDSGSCRILQLLLRRMSTYYNDLHSSEYLLGAVSFSAGDNKNAKLLLSLRTLDHLASQITPKLTADSERTSILAIAALCWATPFGSQESLAMLWKLCGRSLLSAIELRIKCYKKKANGFSTEHIRDFFKYSSYTLMRLAPNVILSEADAQIMLDLLRYPDNDVMRCAIIACWRMSSTPMNRTAFGKKDGITVLINFSTSLLSEALSRHSRRDSPAKAIFWDGGSKRNGHKLYEDGEELSVLGLHKFFLGALWQLLMDSKNREMFCADEKALMHILDIIREPLGHLETIQHITISLWWLLLSDSVVGANLLRYRVPELLYAFSLRSDIPLSLREYAFRELHFLVSRTVIRKNIVNQLVESIGEAPFERLLLRQLWSNEALELQRAAADFLLDFTTKATACKVFMGVGAAKELFSYLKICSDYQITLRLLYSLVNMTTEFDNLDELGRFGIPLLLQFTDAHHYPDLGELAADILENLSKHPENRIRIYKLELQRKAEITKRTGALFETQKQGASEINALSTADSEHPPTTLSQLLSRQRSFIPEVQSTSEFTFDGLAEPVEEDFSDESDDERVTKLSSTMPSGESKIRLLHRRTHANLTGSLQNVVSAAREEKRRIERAGSTWEPRISTATYLQNGHNGKPRKERIATRMLPNTSEVQAQETSPLHGTRVFTKSELETEIKRTLPKLGHDHLAPKPGHNASPVLQRVMKKKATMEKSPSVGMVKTGTHQRKSREQETQALLLSLSPGSKTQSFKFAGSGLKKKNKPRTEKERAKEFFDEGKPKMYMFRHVEGSVVFRDIFPKTTLPDGRKVHTFYQDKMAKASLRVDISPPSPPSDLNDMFHSGGLPAPPEPPAPQPLHIKIGRFESVLKLPPPIPPVPEVLNHECPGSTCTCKGCRVSKRTGLNIRFRVTEKTSMSQHVADMLVKPEWKIESSMWAERKDEDESNDVYTSSKVNTLAFLCDWDRMLAKPRLKRYIKKITRPASESKDLQLQEVQRIFRANYDLICNVFDYYAAFVGDEKEMFTDEFSIQLFAFKEFLVKADIVDETSQYCRMKDLEMMFVTVNFEEGENPLEDELNPDKSLIRSEFLEALLRIANRKYLKSKHVDTLSKAVRVLLHSNMRGKFNHVLFDSVRYRREKLYSEDVDAVLRKREYLVRSLFEAYATFKISNTKEVVSEKQRKLLSVDEWQLMLKDFKLLDSQFTRKDALLAFTWSTPRVSDEMKYRFHATCLPFTGFLEALCRVSELKALPTASDVKSLGAKSEQEFFAVQDNMDIPATGRRPSLGLFEKKTRPLSQKLSTLLTLLDHRTTRLVRVDDKGRKVYEDLAAVAEETRMEFYAVSGGEFTNANIMQFDRRSNDAITGAGPRK